MSTTSTPSSHLPKATQSPQVGQIQIPSTESRSSVPAFAAADYFITIMAMAFLTAAVTKLLKG